MLGVGILRILWIRLLIINEIIQVSLDYHLRYVSIYEALKFNYKLENRKQL